MTASNSPSAARAIASTCTAATGKTVMIYGQTEVTLDLMNARKAAGLTTVYRPPTSSRMISTPIIPASPTSRTASRHEIACDFIAGCDGFHGVSRASVKPSAIETFERVYPFGWLGILSETPPVSHELIYSNHARGFALCTMRSTHRSRYYVQCPLDDHIDQWPDDRFWDELKRRLDQKAVGRTRHRALDREEHRAVAQLRRRADAVRPDVSGRRRRPYRAADRRQGAEPRRQRRALSVARVPRILRREILCRHRRLFRQGAGAGLEGGALLLVDDVDAAQISRQGRIRRADSARRTRITSSTRRRPSTSLAENYVGLPY